MMRTLRATATGSCVCRPGGIGAGRQHCPGRRRDPAVKAWVQTDIDHGIAIMKDKSLTAAQRRARCMTCCPLLDTKKPVCARLGPVAKRASQAELEAYVAAFNEFMIEKYVSADGYGGQPSRSPA